MQKGNGAHAESQVQKEHPAKKGNRMQAQYHVIETFSSTTNEQRQQKLQQLMENHIMRQLYQVFRDGD